MLEKIIMEEKEIQMDTIGRLLELQKILAGSVPTTDKEDKNDCILDYAKSNLERERLIHDFVINLQESIQGGK